MGRTAGPHVTKMLRPTQAVQDGDKIGGDAGLPLEWTDCIVCDGSRSELLFTKTQPGFDSCRPRIASPAQPDAALMRVCAIAHPPGAESV